MHTLKLSEDEEYDDGFKLSIIKKKLEELHGEFVLSGPCKWYDCEDDMKEFSKLFPQTVIIIEGEGEEKYDLWRTYFLNGKYHTVSPKIIFPDFDKSKLG